MESGMRRRTSKASVALFVGGWSPGPLTFLESTATARQIPIVAPKNLPMPPFPGSWCCHPKTLVLLGTIGVLFWVATTPRNHFVWNVSSFLAMVVLGRLLASVVVQTSIEVGGQSCLEAVRAYQRDDNESIVFVGFSWGGAVLAELLAQKRLGERPKVLLIAPTTSLVASIIGYGRQSKDAALRVEDSTVQVVHGSADLGFCPNQNRWTGVNLLVLPDNHVFYRPQSQRTLVDLLSQLLDRDP